jgi:tRNA threonylcarbamoyladenosine biosynthesis protein TsaE
MSGADGRFEVALATRRHTRRLGAEIARHLRPGALVMLDGDLGAGKTFLTRAILRALGVSEREPVQSPTFTLVNEYEVEVGRVLHADLYRLRGAETLEDDVRRLGLPERRREDAIVIVEWGADVEALLGGRPEARVRLAAAETGRTATISGELAAQLAAIA